MLPYFPTPLQDLGNHPLLKKAGVRLIIKREDLNHPFVSGNKWWKLKYNLEAAISTAQNTLLTFGGAYSNHIYATAAAAAELKLRSIGIIRGEEVLPLNPTLKSAADNGMQLHFISRRDYETKASTDFINGLRRKFGDFYLIPEGGSNLEAVKGCAEFAQNELSNIDFDHLLLPVGTGGTMAGVICGLEGRKKITGIAVLKGGDFLRNAIGRMVVDYSNKNYQNWSLFTQFHLGGYARTTPELLSFIKEMNDVYDLPLDHVYTAKLIWAILTLIESGSLSGDDRILALHTGGLQGSVKL